MSMSKPNTTCSSGKSWLTRVVYELDELGLFPLAELGAEFLCQFIADLAERTAVILTTNLRSQNGQKSFQTPGCVKRCSTASRIKHTSSKRVRNLTAFGARLGGKEKGAKR